MRVYVCVVDHCFSLSLCLSVSLALCVYLAVSVAVSGPLLICVRGALVYVPCQCLRRWLCLRGMCLSPAALV